MPRCCTPSETEGAIPNLDKNSLRYHRKSISSSQKVCNRYCIFDSHANICLKTFSVFRVTEVELRGSPLTSQELDAVISRLNPGIKILSLSCGKGSLQDRRKF